MPGVEPSVDAAEVAALRQIEADVATRRQALAAKWGEGAIVMESPGAAEAMIVVKGVLHAVQVSYLTGGPAA